MEDINEVALRVAHEVVDGEVPTNLNDLLDLMANNYAPRLLAELQKDATPVAEVGINEPYLLVPYDEVGYGTKLYTHPQPKAAKPAPHVEEDAQPYAYEYDCGELAGASILHNGIRPVWFQGEPVPLFLSPQPKAATVPHGWKSLNDVQWMNIVNHDRAYENYSKEDAVHEAVKRTEAKLRELNAAPSLPAQSAIGLHAPAHVLDGCGLSFEQCAKIGRHFGVQPHEVDLIVKEAIRVTGHPSQSEGEQK
jgi:hypothetical protein